jgi:hypothetical protein
MSPLRKPLQLPSVVEVTENLHIVNRVCERLQGDEVRLTQLLLDFRVGVFRRFGRADSLGFCDSGGMDGDRFSQAAVASVAGSPGEDQGYAAVMEGGLSTARGAVPGGMRHDREGDDYDDIVDWGKAYLWLLRRFSEFRFGIPCADWLRTVMNRIDPQLFAAWVAECWPEGRTCRHRR